MSSRIELAIIPSAAVGVLAATPWLTLLAFLIIAGVSGKYWLLTAVPVALTGAFVQYRHTGLLRSKKSVMALLIENNQCYARFADNRMIPMHISTGSRMGTRVALLKLRPEDNSLWFCPTILLADIASISGNVAEDDFRRLRMWLRLGRSQMTPA